MHYTFERWYFTDIIVRHVPHSVQVKDQPYHICSYRTMLPLRSVSEVVGRLYSPGSERDWPWVACVMCGWTA